jgi:hypothetical protein
MYPNSGATIRADLNSVLEEASQAESGLIGEKLLPSFGVDAKSGTYPKLTKAISELMKPGDTIRERGGSYGRVKRAWTNDTYDTVDRGLEEAIDDTDAKDAARFFNAEAISAKLVLRAIKLAHERRVAAEIFHASTWGSPTNSAVAYTDALIATIDFPLDVQAAIERVKDNAETPDTIVMSSAVYNRIRRSTLLKSFLVGQNLPGANVTPDAIQQAFAANGIKQVLIGEGRYDSTAKKATQSYTAAPIWSNTYVWVGKVGSGDFMNGGAGRTIVWNAEGGLWVTETYREEATRSNIVRVRQHTVEKIVDANCGTLIATQYA